MFLYMIGMAAHSQRWKEKQWPSVVSLTPGVKNIAWGSVVDSQNHLISSLCKTVLAEAVCKCFAKRLKLFHSSLQ
jgi:hypothetical protein